MLFGRGNRDLRIDLVLAHLLKVTQLAMLSLFLPFVTGIRG
jgi:hypothetical protein